MPTPTPRLTRPRRTRPVYQPRHTLLAERVSPGDARLHAARRLDSLFDARRHHAGRLRLLTLKLRPPRPSVTDALLALVVPSRLTPSLPDRKWP